MKGIRQQTPRFGDSVVLDFLCPHEPNFSLTVRRKGLTCDAWTRYLVFQRLHLWLRSSPSRPRDGKTSLELLHLVSGGTAARLLKILCLQNAFRRRANGILQFKGRLNALAKLVTYSC